MLSPPTLDLISAEGLNVLNIAHLSLLVPFQRVFVNSTCNKNLRDFPFRIQSSIMLLLTGGHVYGGFCGGDRAHRERSSGGVRTRDAIGVS